ncbi:Retinol dehydrogenase 14 [Bagarius yarrelli]|uniref:Retinol dehydrogenase 14 n=1 Tax=Bagarius yarrelli TaxID=175774 RepID=A0A556V4W1_BAGYA|nr:Retinol dehydrogenase 14 [Bagarius yarrelli]
MRGKTVIVTGANSGIGKATAVELLRREARVIMACRSRERAESAAQEIRQQAGSGGGGGDGGGDGGGGGGGGGGGEGELLVRLLDLACMNSVRSFCEQIYKEEPRLDVLINNAGVYQCPYSKTEDGFEMQFGVNHLGHFLLTHLLLDLLKRSAPSRIVVVSSKLYKRGEINFDDLNSENGYDGAAAYSRSKLANLLFTLELGRRLENTGVTVNALTPGIVRTNLGRHVHIPLLAKPLFSLASWALLRSPEEGAKTLVYLACSMEVEGVQGKCFSDCQELKLLPKAADEDVAKKLWDISEVMVGITT